jgi:hypothetical protein
LKAFADRSDSLSEKTLAGTASRPATNDASLAFSVSSLNFVIFATFVVNVLFLFWLRSPR